MERIDAGAEGENAVGSELKPEPPLLASSVGAEPEGEFNGLDERVISVWRIRQFIGSCVLLGLLVIVGLIIGVQFPFLAPWLAGAVFSVGLLQVFLLFWYPVRAFRAWGYRLSDDVLEIRRGFVIHVLQVLPLSRLQHVDLRRGPIERHFGLASLDLFTAGTHEAMLSIPGLAREDAAALRDQLVSRGGHDGV